MCSLVLAPIYHIEHPEAVALIAKCFCARPKTGRAGLHLTPPHHHHCSLVLLGTSAIHASLPLILDFNCSQTVQ